MNSDRATYDKLIGPDGQPQYGRFNQTFAEINYQDFQFCDTMDKPASRLHTHFGFNQFHFISLHNQDYTLACAIANVQYVANAFVYLFEHQTGQMHPYSFMQPLGLRCKQSNRPFSGESRFRKGNATFNVAAKQHPDRYELQVAIGKDIRIAATLSEPDDYESTVVCTRAGYNGWAFTQKHTALEVDGNIKWKQLNISLTDGQFVGSSDWSCGFMRRETAWNWTSISTMLNDGTRLGLNLACGVNETSFSENTLWINGRAQPLAAAQFEFNRKNRMEPWKIRTSDGKVDLSFVPEGCHKEKINALLVASNFSQLPGKYFGTIKTTDGHQYQLEGVNGLIEDHYAKW